MAKLIIEIDEDLKHQFVVKATKEGKTQKELIISFIKEYVKGDK